MLERVHGSIPHGADELETESDHTRAFNASLGRTVAEVIRRGLICASAKEKFARRYERWITDTLNCSTSYASKCRAIAKNNFIANPSNWNGLPPSTAALYYLSGISPERLQTFSAGGELHAKLTIAEAVALAEAERGDYRPRRAAAPAARRRETPAHAEDIEADDVESTDAVADDANGDDDIDRHRLLVDATEVVEELKQTFALCRRRIDAIETHATRTAKAMLATDLRDIAQSLNYRADALDPPTANDDTEPESLNEPTSRSGRRGMARDRRGQR